MNKVLVLNFHTDLHLPSGTFFIRALPVYSNHEHANLPVIRCTLHAYEDDPQSQGKMLLLYNAINDKCYLIYCN